MRRTVGTPVRRLMVSSRHLPEGLVPGCARLWPRSSLVPFHPRDSSQKFSGRGEPGRGRVFARRIPSAVRQSEHLPTTPSPSSARTSGSSTRCTSGTRRDPDSVDTGLVGLLQDARAPDGTGGRPTAAAAPPRPPSSRRQGQPAHGRRAEPAAKPARRSHRAQRRRPSRRREAVRRRRARRRGRRPPSRAEPATAATRCPRSRAPAARPRPPTSRPTPCCAAPRPAPSQNMDAQPDRPDRDQRPLGPGQAAAGTTASSSTTTSPAPAAARCRSPT